MSSEAAKPQKTVLLGVSGGIAAYKSCEIVRGLQKAGVRVKVCMTEHATHFVDPVTFRSLTHEKVAVDLFDDPTDPIHHISLAEEADAFVIAPCTANVLAKLANGIADDLLTTTALACTAPLVLAPAMNVHMYEAAATRYNIGKLGIRGAVFVEADEGYLACGDVGRGRLADPAAIVARTLEVLGVKQDLEGKHVMITAGPTVEPIDPVRYISNRSSGKTGYAIARAARRRGAEVTLISGPVSIPAPTDVRVVNVKTALEMLQACEEVFPSADIALFSAAVADMRPAHAADHKLKKGKEDLGSIELVENPDILATISKDRGDRIVIGFAAETNDVIDNAKKKLARKGCDLIVANDVTRADSTFGSDTDAVTLVGVHSETEYPCMPKAEVANVLVSLRFPPPMPR